MNRIPLDIELGSWDGGHDGTYPKLTVFDIRSPSTPFVITEGWGHGLMGRGYSSREFLESGLLENLNKPNSRWAYQVIKLSFSENKKPEAMFELLLESYRNNPLNISDHLLSCLRF